jgi:hypothetical protein
MLFTQSQQAARNTLLQMGKLFYSGVQIMPDLKLRLNPLVLGATGTGKTLLVQTAAHRLGAQYLKLTRGDWLVAGCRSGRPTMLQILDYVSTYDRVLLHIDELDKLTNLQNGDWAASIASDLWNVLDLRFQLPDFFRESTFPGREAPTAAEMEARIRKLWVVGSGTFQEVFEGSRAGSSIGFGRDLNKEKVALETIVKSGIISNELLHRFNGDLIFLEYPSLEETRSLLNSSGISSLARRLGVTIGPEAIDWTQGGMRALETVATRLALAYHRQNPASPTKLPAPQAGQAAGQLS